MWGNLYELAVILSDLKFSVAPALALTMDNRHTLLAYFCAIVCSLFATSGRLLSVTK